MTLINNPAQPVHVTEDKRLLTESYGGESFIATPVIIDIFMGEEKVFAWGYVFPWWPIPSMLVSDTGMTDILDAVWFHTYYPVSGANGRLGFAGVTRDQYGSPLGNCTVRCVRASTNEIVSQVISDVNGNFIATSPYNDSHFLVVHGTGVAGATIDTLIPS